MQSARSRSIELANRVRHEADPIVLARGYTLRGRVIDQEDAPIAGAQLRIRGGSGSSRYRGATEADAEGRFRFEALPPDALQLRVEKEGFLEHRDDAVDAARGEELVVRLESGLRVRGTVVDAVTREPIERFAPTLRRVGDVEARTLRQYRAAARATDHRVAAAGGKQRRTRLAREPARARSRVRVATRALSQIIPNEAAQPSPAER